MAPCTILGLVAFSLACSLVNSQTPPNTDVANYIYWKKADISAWHRYFPSRVLQEELLTNQAAVAAVSSLASGLSSGLSKVVAFQAQELLTAQQLMNGTDAAGCVAGISNYMTEAISDETSAYNECAADALSNLNRLNKTLKGLTDTYMAAYQKALARIDACAKTYPNKDSLDRLKSCVEAMNNNYFLVANATQKAVFPSPSMGYFQNVVVGCARRAATAVATKGSKFLQLLLDCSVLDSDIDQATYAEQLSQWQGYNDTLATQITISQSKNYDQVWTVENEMTAYYNLQKETLEKYVIESRGLAFYVNRMYSYLSDYYNTVTATSADNPGDSDCVASANSALQTVVNSVAAKSLSCDQQIVNNTEQMMTAIAGDFSYLNAIMPRIGNAAVLDCIAQGYVFAPNTVAACFDLVSSQFNVLYNDRNADIAQKVAVLTGYESSFFSGSDLPCGGTTLQSAYLAAEVTLYNLQRCLYISSGTEYSVTTPPSHTTPQAPPPPTPFNASGAWYW